MKLKRRQIRRYCHSSQIGERYRVSDEPHLSASGAQCALDSRLGTMRTAWTCLLLLALAGCHGDLYHGAFENRGTIARTASEAESDPAHWAREAYAAIADRRARGAAGSAARAATRVVLFLGDGMSVPTLSAARTLLGGEESQLSFEAFPTVGLAKTYCVDSQTADSACSATAYLCGAKANYGTLGVSAAVPRGDCAAARDVDRHVASIAAWALAAGRDAGIVTTTRVTHASPAGAYAHSAERDWESDADVRSACGDRPDAQEDIALQLIRSHPGTDFRVILGGGRREFLPAGAVDAEGAAGRRLDGRDLTAEWAADRRARNVSHAYVTTRAELLRALEDEPEHLLGLFAPSHLPYRLEARAERPSLAEMTEAAIRTLGRDGRGFFLFVEAGRIDHAHHDNLARLALDETVELSEAVARAAELLPADESLLVVTADHAHVMSLAGYAARGADVRGAGTVADDGLPYMTLAYANGPGHRRAELDGGRVDVTLEDDGSPWFVHPAAAPLESETHGGDDVGVFARGVAHGMFSGLYEQSQLPHLMAHAACIGPGPRLCDDDL